MCVSWLNCVLFIKLLSKDAQVLLQKLGVEEVSEAILLTCRNTICLYFAWYSVRKTEISLYRSFQTLDLVFLQDEGYNKGISCTEKWLDFFFWKREMARFKHSDTNIFTNGWCSILWLIQWLIQSKNNVSSGILCSHHMHNIWILQLCVWESNYYCGGFILKIMLQSWAKRNSLFIGNGDKSCSWIKKWWREVVNTWGCRGLFLELRCRLSA